MAGVHLVGAKKHVEILIMTWKPQVDRLPFEVVKLVVCIEKYIRDQSQSCLKLCVY